MDNIVKSITSLKSKFAENYKGNSHIHEAIPISSSEFLTIDENDLDWLHKFAASNPIYYNSFEMEILDTPCRVYEGDINEYWLDSIKHDTSYAPFYPTWILSAYALALETKNLGFDQVVDIGSGDGRISFCAKLIGIESFAIEIDEKLVELQNKIASMTGINFNPKIADATKFDYKSLKLNRPAFFISGLPEMGEMLANSVIENITSIPDLKNTTTFVLSGSHLMRKNSRDHTKWGWGTVIENFDLEVIKTLTLPTRWTVDQPIDTPYVFTTSRQK
ncbi:MAG TPA: hypothetical protein VLC72_02255 [Nitrosopumilaceae archaeon]|nr:hypothetical protein [Nitrosopumilaceae archaeon]